ncbi:MAG: alpha/beta fold hydrolase [Bacteriovorax sp.]|nr:alpha/beta fold hydrolase [Bacteriovorax sp.]
MFRNSYCVLRKDNKIILHHQYVKDDKSQKPVLVMLHGLLSSHETFLPLIPALRSHFDLLLIDQRGHGLTPAEGEDYTAERMARDVFELLDYLKITKIIILGHSMGGRTALMFGALFPEMIDKMIIEDMGIHQRQERTLERDLEKLSLARKSRVPSLIFKSKEEIFEVISPLFPYAKDLLKTKVVMLAPDKFELKFWPDVSVLYGYQGNYTDLTFALTESKFPVMLLIADPKVGSALTPKCIEHIKTHVPRAILHPIAKSWHNIHKTHPTEFCESLIAFIKS